MSGVRLTLVVLDAFVGVTAIGGGIMLATGLESERYDVALLERTPFRSYLVPGLILAMVVGGSAAAAAVFVVLDDPTGGWLSILAGLALIGQIVGELVLLRQGIHWIEVWYVAVAAAMIGFGWAWWQV